ncbi:uncharacterized protein LOC143066926 [Mytilus galloprovincialis]|uniref:Uncharacterized protein n=1 Tax=Mytilus galloprovincialis TaxID=29158 RepID=A0A8B6GPG7_MYTGA|nr:Hypothetical predicted protein [Mytilus galloprovincialis]
MKTVIVVLLLSLCQLVSSITRATCSLPGAMQGKCQCQGNIVKCEDLDYIATQTGGSAFLRLEVRNSNLSINASSFNSWGLTEILLENCQLTDSSFPPGDFHGLENSLRLLSLKDNELTRLPKFLSKFTNIETLDVSGNPIPHYNFNEDILRDIGDSLLSFSFGTKIGGTELSQWPLTLKHLVKLQEIILTAADITIMPTNSFHGFEGTLLRLTLANTKLRSVPLAISRLRYLQDLHFDHNQNVGDYGVRIPLIKGFLPFLNQMSLKDDNITTFPEVLQSFDRLDQLNMDENNLKFVSDKSAKAVTQITSLSLQHSGITRIPGAIQDITYLNILDLSNNSIHAIETNDLKESAELLTLKLNNNPILYISDKAFVNQTKLRRLELKGIAIKRVPCALEAMIRRHQPGYVIVDLSNNKIECNCGLKWLFDVKNDRHTRTRFRIVGNCDTVDKTIQDYLDSDLATCPNGINCTDS